MEREAGQGNHEVKRVQADVETLWTKVDATGWNAEKERASEEALREAKDDAMRCTQVRTLGLSSEMA